MWIRNPFSRVWPIYVCRFVPDCRTVCEMVHPKQFKDEPLIIVTGMGAGNMDLPGGQVMSSDLETGLPVLLGGPLTPHILGNCSSAQHPPLPSMINGVSWLIVLMSQPKHLHWLILLMVHPRTLWNDWLIDCAGFDPFSLQIAWEPWRM